MATPAVCGWAGAIFEVVEHLGNTSAAKDCKNAEKNEV